MFDFQITNEHKIPPKQRLVKFTDDDITRILELYSKEQILYDSTKDDYHSKFARSAAINRICQGLNIPGLGPRDVVSKVKSLRNTYRYELRKIFNMSRSGTNYVPKAFWFKQINSFLRPYMQCHYQLPLNIVTIYYYN